jgi:2-methylisocitrate lyase-like PEP mutase family enzyme
MGVARVSTGSGVARAVAGLTRRIAVELREDGSYQSLFADPIPYAEVNEMMHYTPKSPGRT